MIEFEEYDRLFEGYRSVAYVGSCSINETEAEDNGFEVREASFYNLTSGVIVPHEVMKMVTSVYKKTQAPNFLYHDCDGIFCHRDGDVLVINLCELKTTARADSVNEAREQILCSMVKMRMLLSHLKSYDGKIKVRGFIVAHELTTAQKSMLKRPFDSKERFLMNIVNNKPYPVSKSKLEELYNPIRMESIDFYFVSVPRGHQKVNVDYSRF